MNAGRISPIFFSVTQPSAHSLPPNSSLKRKFGSLAPPVGPDYLCYPSPPMSRPPSPPQIGPELSHNVGDEAAPSIPPTTLPSTHPNSNVPTSTSTSPGSGLLQRSEALSGRQTPNTSLDNPPLAVQLPPEAPRLAPPAFTVYPTSTVQTSGRTSRKSKTHVASACVNCKRAHLSCDVQRPCARCVASGKQDTCYDVQHKKRGRPRLRDDGDFKVERMLPDPPSSIALPDTPVPSSSRPIATPRQRRAGSFRSLHSQASESSTDQPLRPPPYHAPQPPKGYQQLRNDRLAPTDVPTAFLDVDLVILRANPPFEQIIANDRKLAGRSLYDTVNPADGQSFGSIRDALKAERQTRELSSLPPIRPPGHDPIQGVSEADIDRLTSGFKDHTYTWTRSTAGRGAETFPARVRLAKSSAYFVVVTLPTFRPMGAPPGSLMPAPYFTGPQPSYLPIQRVQSATPVQHPLPHPGRSTSQPPPFPPPQYPTSQWSTNYHQTPRPATPRLPVIEPPTHITPFSSRASTAEMLPPADPGGVQLPPIAVSPLIPSRPSSVSTDIQAPRASASEDEREERMPKKRRIMGIDSVLQR